MLHAKQEIRVQFISYFMQAGVPCCGFFPTAVLKIIGKRLNYGLYANLLCPSKACNPGTVTDWCVFSAPLGRLAWKPEFGLAPKSQWPPLRCLMSYIGAF